MTKFIDVSNDTKKVKKETVLTHRQEESEGWVETKLKPQDYLEVRYLGKCQKDGDMFAAYDGACIDTFKGIKGDEFN